jgi:imidazolonepropionase-like amidohydrolase
VIFNTVAVRVGKLYDGSSRPPIDDAVVVVGEDTIVDVLQPSDQRKLACYGANLIDHGDKYMTPGLIDAHVHLMFPANGWLGEELLDKMTPGELHMQALKNALQALRFGITAVRDCGSAFWVSHSLRKFIGEGNILGPDLIICGMPVTPTGGHCHYMGGEADGEHEIRKLIRRQQKDGVDFIKIMATSGGTRGTPAGYTYTQAEYLAAVHESHKVGLKISMHATDTPGIREIINTDPDGFEHGFFYDHNYKADLDVGLAAKIAEKAIVVCPTLPIYSENMRAIKQKPIAEWTASDKREYERQASLEEEMMKSFQLHVKEGVISVAGSDSGWKFCRFGHGLLRQLELMSEGGMKNLDIIHAATALPAKYMGVGDRIGGIRKGLQADFLILEADPGKSVSNFRKLHSVYKKGRLVKSVI